MYRIVISANSVSRRETLGGFPMSALGSSASISVCPR